MLRTHTKFVLVTAGVCLLGGCQNIGPLAIDQGRDRYNHAIETTTKEQTFANILRVYYREPTLFMDVTEVDATSTLLGSVNGGVSGIGARPGTSGGTLAGQVGSVAGGVTYSESPLIRYQPLLGQALVAQLATPVSPDVIWSLYSSGWNVAPLLNFAAAWLTLDSDETYAALNTIAELDGRSALQLTAEKSDVTKAKDEMASGKLPAGKNGSVTLQVTNKSSSPSSSDALAFYLLPYHPHDPKQNSKEKRYRQMLWDLLKKLYEGSQPKCQPAKPAPVKGGGAKDAAGEKNGSASCKSRPKDSIEVRTMPLTSQKMSSSNIMSGAPMMRTNSALGILKSATEQPYPRTAFIGRDDYLRIRQYPWNHPRRQDSDLSYYTLPPDNQTASDESLTDLPSKAKAGAYHREAVKWLTYCAEGSENCVQGPEAQEPHRVYLPQDPIKAFDDFVKVNQLLGHQRRYILIIEGEAPPPADAYVAHFVHGKWYYIDGDDQISQKNFDLIALFMTMMAVAPTTSPLTPAISVGGT